MTLTYGFHNELAARVNVLIAKFAKPPLETAQGIFGSQDLHNIRIGKIQDKDVIYCEFLQFHNT
jgi:hypothetical protein